MAAGQDVTRALRIGDTLPDFTAQTTQGSIRYREWSAGNWVVLFTHPCAFTPVCTTEVADFGYIQPKLVERGVRLLGLTNSSLEDEARWVEDIAAIYCTPLTYPIISDPEGELARSCGVSCHDGGGRPVRRTYIIDPDHGVRMLFEYPHGVGRSTGELLRVLDALQMLDRHAVGVPGNWETGMPCVLMPDEPRIEALRRFPSGWLEVRDYLRVVVPDAEDPRDT